MGSIPVIAMGEELTKKSYFSQLFKEKPPGMDGVHKTVNSHSTLLWLFLYYILFCDNMKPNRYTNRNLAKECDCMKKKFFVVIAIIVVIGNIL